MRNKPDSGFSFKGLNKMKTSTLFKAIPDMSCEELLTARILVSTTTAAKKLQAELARRAELGDQIECVNGYERVASASNGVIRVDGRDQRYGSRTAGFYISRDVLNVCYYECRLLDVDWSATMVYDDPEHWMRSPFMLTVKARGNEFTLRSEDL